MIEHGFLPSGDRPYLLERSLNPSLLLNKSFSSCNLASSIFNARPGTCPTYPMCTESLTDYFIAAAQIVDFWFWSKVWLVGHGLDPLYEHVAAKWRHFCQQDDAEKRKYSALWYVSCFYYWIPLTLISYKNLPKMTFYEKVREQWVQQGWSWSCCKVFFNNFWATTQFLLFDSISLSNWQMSIYPTQ